MARVYRLLKEAGEDMSKDDCCRSSMARTIRSSSHRPTETAEAAKLTELPAR
jgi:hypothetical protein